MTTPATQPRIPTSEIQADIADTRTEIERMEQEAAHLEATPRTSSDYRWNMMRASARRTGIAERHAFIAKLEKILAEREESPGGDATEQPVTESPEERKQ